MKKFDTINRIHLHIPAMINRTELWLKRQANAGWRLIEVHRNVFVFRKCSPYEGEYLMYSTFGKEKGLSFDYYMTKKIYGKTNGKSELNRQNGGVFEADTTKLDEEYYRFVRMRNSYYLKHYIGLTAIFLIFMALVIGITLLEDYKAITLMIVVLPPLIYALISSIILIKDIRTLK